MIDARRRLAAIAALVLAALVLSGCTVFAEPDPPDVVESATARALADIRSIDGIGQAEVEVSLRDSMVDGPALEDPLEWIARFTVSTTGAPDLERVVVLVDAALDRLRDTVPAVARLDDERAGAAPARLELGPVAADSTTAARAVAVTAALRTVDALVAVTVSTFPDPVRADVPSPDDWTAGVAGIRALPSFGGPGLESATLTSTRADGRSATLTFDAASPADGLPEVLAGVFAQQAVSDLWFDGVRPADDTTEAWRPILTVYTTTPAAARELAGLLAAVPDAQPAATPRPAFRILVQQSSHGAGEYGFIGLPLGSVAPDDALPVPVVEPPPIDPVVAAAQLERGRALIDELFAEAGTVAGIAGTATAETIPCDDGWGEQVQARTLIPVFEITDSADAAFAAIVGAWGERGYEYADRGMGTDFYASAELERLTIRGGVDGISIAALSPCTG